jgi:hypothetical protein
MGKGPHKVTDPNQTPNAVTCFSGVRQCGISFIAERETTQTAS